MDDSLRESGYQKFIALLIEQRVRVGMTQADVAQALKKPQSFVSKYEHGERRLDIIETMILCKIIGLAPQTLLSELSKGDQPSDV